MNICVTGGAGFIASHVVDRYVADGHQVQVVDNLSTGVRANLNPQADFHEVDILDIERLRQVFEERHIDIVNHHAAQIDVRKSTQIPTYDARCNILGSLNLIQLCIEYGVEKMIYISTGGAVYGEPEYLPVDESHPIRPLCEYGISKHTVEHYLELYSLRGSLRYTVLRYPNVYGPRQNPHGEAGVVAIFTTKVLHGESITLFGRGEPTRDYVYVSDIAEANAIAMTRGDNAIYNLGSGIGTSVKEVFDAVCAAVGRTADVSLAPLRPGEIMHTRIAADKAARELGWKWTTGVEEGIARTVQWQIAQGS